MQRETESTVIFLLEAVTGSSFSYSGFILFCLQSCAGACGRHLPHGFCAVEDDEAFNFY